MKKLLAILSVSPLAITGCTTQVEETIVEDESTGIYECKVILGDEIINLEPINDVFESLSYRLMAYHEPTWTHLSFYGIVDDKFAYGHVVDSIVISTLNMHTNENWTMELLLDAVNDQLDWKHWGNLQEHCAYNVKYKELLF